MIFHRRLREQANRLASLVRVQFLEGVAKSVHIELISIRLPLLGCLSQCVVLDSDLSSIHTCTLQPLWLAPGAKARALSNVQRERAIGLVRALGLVRAQKPEL